jgi:putative DNA primase/helicase
MDNPDAANFVTESTKAGYGGTKHAKRVVRVELISLEDLKMEPTDWAWAGWLARGQLHLIAGVPEAGKTTIALKLAATQSSGGLWPDGTKAEPGNVLIWTGEDDPARTIKPRLVAMGADLSKVLIVKAKRDNDGKLITFDPSMDLPALALRAKEMPGGVDMLSVDPIVSVIGGKVDNGNNAGHREKLQPLVDFGEEMKCVVIGITHFTKGTIGKNPIDRVTGSLAFGAVARIVLAATKNASGDPERMFLMAKNNLGPPRGGYGYSIVGGQLKEDERIIASRIVWGETLEGSARDLLAQAEDDGKHHGKGGRRHEVDLGAKAFLEKALSAGERQAKDVIAEAVQAGFSQDKISRDATDIGVIKWKRGFGTTGEWMWKLTDKAPM